MEDVTPERWLPVPDWEGRYEVSDLGRVKSLRRLRDGTLRIHMMKPRPTVRGGHMHMRLSAPGRRVMAYVHQMVMAAFVGPCPPGEEVRHWDGDPSNNRLSNLRYGTKAENGQDTVRHGRSLAGSRHPRSALTENDVIAMRIAWQQGTSVKDLVIQYGISKATVSRAVHGLSYRKVAMFPRAPEKCHYPLCERPVMAGTNGRGQPHKFCDDLAHDNNSAKSARSRLERQAA